VAEGGTCGCLLQVNDGSNMSGIQVVVEPEASGFALFEAGKIQTGASTATAAAAAAAAG
jgi:hypothetical protein